MSASGFVLDTNVVSEAMRPRPDRRVVAWLREHDARSWLSVVTIGEIEAGIRGARGTPIGAVDALIAATAARHGLVVATRDVRDFEHLEVDTVDPWAAA